MLQFIDVMNLISVANVSMQDILAFNVTQEYTNNSVYLVNFVNNTAKR